MKSVALSHTARRLYVSFPQASVHMCMNVSVFPEELDVFQDTISFSHIRQLILEEHNTPYQVQSWNHHQGKQTIQYNVKPQLQKGQRDKERWSQPKRNFYNTVYLRHLFCKVEKHQKMQEDICTSEGNLMFCLELGWFPYSYLALWKQWNNITIILGPNVVFKDHHQVSGSADPGYKSILCFCC